MLPVCAIFLLPAAAFAQADFYWDNPEQFSPGEGQFPQSGNGGGVAAIAWQEKTVLSGSGAGERGEIYVSVAVSQDEHQTDGNGDGWQQKAEWTVHRRIAGPYPYSGTAPWLYNLCVDSRGHIIFSIASSTLRTEILVSRDRGGSFRRVVIATSSEDNGDYSDVYDLDDEARTDTPELVAPRIFQLSNGGYLMFAGRGVSRSLTLYYSVSKDALNWQPFEPFTKNDPALTLNFLPSHASFDGAEYVVFQSYITGVGNRLSPQLYIKMSTNGGLTWTEARRVTDFRDPVSNTLENPDNFNNERPNLTAYNGRLFLVWERKYISGGTSIYAISLEKNGEAAGRAEKINTVNAVCMSPVSVIIGGRLFVLWFDNRYGSNAAVMARREGYIWEERVISASQRNATFVSPAVTNESLYVFWQDTYGGASRIYYREQDRSAPSPRLRALNFTAGEPIRSSSARMAWNTPADPSGVLGFSWSWGREKDAIPRRNVMIPANSADNVTTLECAADEDGPWYFSVSVADYAGNWSAPETIRFIRDTTPPPPPVIPRLPIDGAGYIVSNTFTLRWEETTTQDLAGFFWSLEYVSSGAAGMDAEGWRAYEAREESEFSGTRAVRNLGMRTSLYCDDIDNGIYRLFVYALDMVGNVSRPAAYYFRLNKYIARTYITVLNAAQDEQGKLTLNIIGRGFSDGGNVSEVIFQKTDAGTAERILPLSSNAYRVRGDREIYIPGVEHLRGGEYYISVVHPLRGRAQSPTPLVIGRTQTVKYGDFSKTWHQAWKTREGRAVTLDSPVLFLAAGAVFLGLLAALAFTTSRFIIRERNAIRLEILAILNRDYMPEERKQLIAKRQRQRSRGLRFKLILFTVSIVIMVVVVVSIPLYRMMVVTERNTLLDSLYARSSVLLESLGTSARVFLPTNNILELGYLPAQSASIPEARYVTITGYGEGATVTPDYVWATNDPGIRTKIDTQEFAPGVSRISDKLAPLLETYQNELNTNAAREIGSLTQTVSELNTESLSLLERTDAESLERIANIQSTTRTLESRITEILSAMNKDIRSEPAYTINNYLQTDIFILYKPILFRQGSSDIYMRGMVRLEISTASIREVLSERQAGILRTILFVALVALIIGFLGALLLSSIIIGPILALVSHVEKIRDTEDKSKLEGEDILLKSKDELAVLANTINDMTHGLVKAAIASQDLTIGKEIQKKFIPLEVDSRGSKRTYGFAKTSKVLFFGYYEGAKGVSGDYFDYRNLDDRYFAMIKCDVAGKGVPAALIMAQVATMFINYFNGWKPGVSGFEIQDLVYQINNFIEKLGFEGRFAAFTLCLFDTETGLLRFCNAGDNIVHIYDHSERRVKVVTLPQTPAAGILPNSMVQSGGGYHVDTLQIDRGDILLLYTDGIEEAKRNFRNMRYEEVMCDYNGQPADTPHANHVVGQWNEEMGADRVEDIINTVMNKSVYKLFKYHNPEGDIEYHFDFTNCSETVEDLILALVSVEKIFRMYNNPAASDSRILVDSRIDTFLKEHFLEYNKYCTQKEPFPESDSYIYYLGAGEDEQYDDLTILGIKRR
ncbi:MAG: SpoIIE family protein phosphatase [Spirochaetaceae bacterium]|nr:SpoIIE family protein phosphatase [Spirochaetaceae bacterium]